MSCWRAVMSAVTLTACASDRGAHAIGDAAPPSDTDVEADADTRPEADAEPDEEPGPTDSGPMPDDYVWSCPTTSNPAPIFTADLTDLDSIKVIHPLGAAFSGEIRGHTYVMNVSDAAVPVYLPHDAYLEELLFLSGSLTASEGDWGLIFRASCEVVILLEHITQPIEAIRALWVGEPVTDSRKSQKLETQVFFTAGTKIADTTGTLAHVWDFGVYNTTHENVFANQARYTPLDATPGAFSKYVHAVCPYEQFDSALKQTYLDKLGSVGAAMPIAGATCRSAVRDVVGTAAGAWFLNSGADDTYHSRIGIVSEFGGSTTVGGIGPSWTLGYGGAKPPEDVTGSHCWGNDSEWVFVSLLSSTEMNVAYGTGACPASFPTSGFKTYAR